MAMIEYFFILAHNYHNAADTMNILLEQPMQKFLIAWSCTVFEPFFTYSAIKNISLLRGLFEPVDHSPLTQCMQQMASSLELFSFVCPTCIQNDVCVQHPT